MLKLQTNIKVHNGCRQLRIWSCVLANGFYHVNCVETCSNQSGVPLLFTKKHLEGRHILLQSLEPTYSSEFEVQSHPSQSDCGNQLEAIILSDCSVMIMEHKMETCSRIFFLLDVCFWLKFDTMIADSEFPWTSAWKCGYPNSNLFLHFDVHFLSSSWHNEFHQSFERCCWVCGFCHQYQF